MITRPIKNYLFNSFHLIRILNPLCSKKIPPKIPQINQVKNQWNQFSDGYSKFDLGPQTFYYSFLTLMNLHQSNNILEVACGNGKLLPLAVMLKNQQSKYLAVDLAQNMIKATQSNLQTNLSKYDSKLSLDQWFLKNNLTLKVANAEQKIIQNNQKFDRIICNLVLMLTQNPQKMLKSLYQQADKGCLFGVTVWGDKNKNGFMNSMRESILQAGFELPNSRSNFHLYRKVDKMAQKIGWQTVLRWQQNVLFPLIQFDYQNYKQLFMHQISKLPQNQRQKVKNILIEKIKKLFEKRKG